MAERDSSWLSWRLSRKGYKASHPLSLFSPLSMSFFSFCSSVSFFFLFTFNFPQPLFPFNFSSCILFLSLFALLLTFLFSFTSCLHHYLFLAIETVSSACIEWAFSDSHMFHMVMIKPPLDPFQRRDLLRAGGGMGSEGEWRGWRALSNSPLSNGCHRLNRVKGKSASNSPEASPKITG